MKKGVLALALVSMVALLATGVSAYAGVDTSGPHEVWAIINVTDPDGNPYTLNLLGWRERYVATCPEADGTISHQVWEVDATSILLPRVGVGDNVMSVHGCYEDWTYKWIFNAKDFNLHLEALLGNWSCCVTKGPHGGWFAAISGKSYGVPVSGTVEWQLITNVPVPF